MMRATPDQEWWTADDLASSGLPDLPTTKRRVNALADRSGWRGHPTFARPRSGRGGGYEYHWKLLPTRAQTALLKRTGQSEDAPSDAGVMTRDEAWLWFDSLPQAVKVKAQHRLTVLQNVEALEAAMGKFNAANQIARAEKMSVRSIWNWFEMVEGVDHADRLPFLAPRHRKGTKSQTTAEASPQFFDWLKADYLRLEAPDFTAAYDNAVKLCKPKGLSFLTLRTARRWMDRTVPATVQTFAREGMRGLQKRYPPQKRDRTGMVALEGVNADFHKIDVFVIWPGIEKPMRPQIGAFQDLYSGKILSWCVDYAPNKVATMSAFAEMVDLWGIPQHCLFDNGMEFANKWLTGGTENRFRFPVSDNDPLGILPQMGIQVHFATPGHGQAKPIERAFRDLASRVAKDPRFAGAYVGNRPDAKPENYMSKAIDLETFLAVLEEGINDHNAREGRLSDTAKGRSFDTTFAASYANQPIRKATEEQRRLWLMGQEVKKLRRGHGLLAMHEGEYWADWMAEHAGERIIARFDPEDLHAGAYIYALDGSFLGYAECRKKAPFFSLASARIHGREKAKFAKEQRKLLKNLQSMSVGKLAADLNALDTPQVAPMEAKVVQLQQLTERSRGTLIQRPLPAPVTDSATDERQSAFVVEFQRSVEAKATAKLDTPHDRFLRALEIERRSEAGQPLGEAEVEWLRLYQTQPEYRSQRMLFEDFPESFTG